MSIDGINGTPATLRQATSLTDGGSNTASVRGRVAQSAEVDETSGISEASKSADKPAPLRFPWLSRLSTQLAAASKTPTTFSAPVLGDNINKQA